MTKEGDGECFEARKQIACGDFKFLELGLGMVSLIVHFHFYF